MKIITIAALIVINTFLLTGCWDMREINELGLVMAVGIDRDSGSNDYVVTVQIANPVSVSPESAKGATKVWVGTARGRTIFDAVRALAQISSRRIMWAHNNVIIIGESVAKDGILPVIDFFTHNPEVRMKTFVVVSKGDAKPYVTAPTGLDEITGLGFREMYRYELLIGKSVQSNMLRVNREYFSKDMQPVISGIDLKREIIKPTTDKPEQETDTVVFEGAAVFKGDKMVGWLSSDETRGLAWIRNETRSTLVTVAVPGYGNRSVSVETSKVKAKIKTQVNNGIPEITIELSGDARIVEEDNSTNLSIDEFKTLIEKLVEEKIASDIRLTLDKVQREYKSDIVGFGTNIHAQHKEQWDLIRDQWPSLFPSIPVNISVNIRIKSSTTLQQPLRGIKEESNE